MKIKDVERIVGLSQSNIRFYEEAGLIKPSRLDNNYRNYSQQDVETLKGIKKLRIIGLSIDQIKDVYTKNKSLEDCLCLRLKEIEVERSNLVQIEKLCKSAIESHLSIESIENLVVDEKNDTIKCIIKRILQTDTYVDTIGRKSLKSIVLALYTLGALLGIIMAFIMMVFMQKNSHSLNLHEIGFSNYGGALDGSAVFVIAAIIPTVVIFIFSRGVKSGATYIVMSVIAALNQALMIQGLIGLVDGIFKNIFSISDNSVERMAIISFATIIFFIICFFLVLVLFAVKNTSKNSIILSVLLGGIATPIIVFIIKGFASGKLDISILIAISFVSFIYIFGTTMIWNMATRAEFRLSVFYALMTATDMLNVAGVIFDLRGRYGSYNIRRTREEEEKFYAGEENNLFNK